MIRNLYPRWKTGFSVFYKFSSRCVKVFIKSCWVYKTLSQKWIKAHVAFRSYDWKQLCPYFSENLGKCFFYKGLLAKDFHNQSRSKNYQKMKNWLLNWIQLWRRWKCLTFKKFNGRHPLEGKTHQKENLSTRHDDSKGFAHFDLGFL